MHNVIMEWFHVHGDEWRCGVEIDQVESMTGTKAKFSEKQQW